MALHLQKLTRQVRQFRTFSLLKVDMCVNIVVVHAVNEIRKPVTLSIQVGSVDLENVTRKYNLRIFPGACDNRFYFMRR